LRAIHLDDIVVDKDHCIGRLDLELNDAGRVVMLNVIAAATAINEATAAPLAAAKASMSSIVGGPPRRRSFSRFASDCQERPPA